ncbi:MAG: hypothetical protein R3F37_02160 [Candidatus Competibacteraceae bacterium]
MNRIALLIGLLLGPIALAPVTRGMNRFPDEAMGLQKSSVFDVLVPESFSYNEAFPGTVENLPPAYPGAPPQIPHTIDLFVPRLRRIICVWAATIINSSGTKDKVCSNPHAGESLHRSAQCARLRSLSR